MPISALNLQVLAKCESLGSACMFLRVAAAPRPWFMIAMEALTKNGLIRVLQKSKAATAVVWN
jgi:hypothetical protein